MQGEISTNISDQSIILTETFKLMHHTLGNIKYVSIQQTLSEVYNKLFKLNIEFTKSFSYYSNIHIDTLPLITYGINQVKYQNFHIFFKKVTNIDHHFDQISNAEKKRITADLEKIIFNDLQLFLSLNNYYLNRNNLTPKEIIKKIFRNLYEPVTCLKTYFNDRFFLNEVRRVFEIKGIEQIYYIIASINKKIEYYLEKEGLEYCKNVSSRNINSIDLAIYAAVKTQQSVLPSNLNFKFAYANILVQEIDSMIHNKTHVKNEIIILPPTELVVSKSIPETKLIFNQYDDIDLISNPEIKKKEFRVKTYFTVGFFGLLLYLKFKGKN